MVHLHYMERVTRLELASVPTKASLLRGPYLRLKNYAVIPHSRWRQRVLGKKENGDIPNGTSPLHGASDEARTRYLHLGKVALYQMSYTRGDKRYYSRFFGKVNPLFQKN